MYPCPRGDRGAYRGVARGGGTLRGHGTPPKKKTEPNVHCTKGRKTRRKSLHLNGLPFYHHNTFARWTKAAFHASNWHGPVPTMLQWWWGSFASLHNILLVDWDGIALSGCRIRTKLVNHSNCQGNLGSTAGNQSRPIVTGQGSLMVAVGPISLSASILIGDGVRNAASELVLVRVVHPKPTALTAGVTALPAQCSAMFCFVLPAIICLTFISYYYLFHPQADTPNF